MNPLFFDKRSKAVCFGLFISLCLSLSAADYYVSTSGSDSANGSSASPWKTLSHAGKSVAPGDTVIVSPGNYGEMVKVTVSGLEDQKITFKSEEKHKASVKGFELLADYIRIEGFEVSGGRNGINAGEVHRGTGRKGCEMLDNYIHDVKWTAIYGGSHALVKGNLIKNIGRGTFVNSHSLVIDNEIDTLVPLPKKKPTPKKKYEKTCYNFFSGDHITYRNNYMHGTEEQYLVAHSKGGLGVCFFTSWDEWIFPSSHHILIEGNKGFNATHASEPTADRKKESSHITYRNNLFVNTVYVGIFPRNFKNIVVENNTLIDCGAYPIWFKKEHMAQDSIIRNNLIAYTNDRQRVVDAYQWKPAENGIKVGRPSHIPLLKAYGSNIMYRTKMRPYGNGDKIADPMFVDLENGDFRLRPGSPAINAGIAIPEITSDVDGNPRDASIDIGAYEFISNASL